MHNSTIYGMFTGTVVLVLVHSKIVKVLIVATPNSNRLIQVILNSKQLIEEEPYTYAVIMATLMTFGNLNVYTTLS